MILRALISAVIGIAIIGILFLTPILLAHYPYYETWLYQALFWSHLS